MVVHQKTHQLMMVLQEDQVVVRLVIIWDQILEEQEIE